MKNKINAWIILTGILIGAIAYWRIPYSDVNLLDDGLWLIMGIATFIGSLASFLIFKQQPWKIALLLSLGVVLSILIRIIFDVTFWDPRSHNLGPIEIVIGALQALPMSFAGAYLGMIFKKPADN